MKNFKPKISKEELDLLPGMAFDGEIVLVEDLAKQEKIAKELLKSDIIGFDTESRSSFKKGVKNKISLLQMATRGKVYLFRLNKTKLHPDIVALLASQSVKKIGVAVKEDIAELQKVAKFEGKGFIDLQSIVGEWGILDMALQKICGIVLERRISKNQRLSNWEAKKLSEAQTAYAATDAWICGTIYKKLIITQKPTAEELEEIRMEDYKDRSVTSEMQIRVPYADVDRMGFLYHAHYLKYFDMARTEMIRANGMTNLGMEEEGVMLPVIKAELQYKSAAHYDELITVRSIICKMPTVTMVFEHEVSRGEELLCRGRVTLAFMNSETKKACRPPKKMIEMFKNLGL